MDLSYLNVQDAALRGGKFKVGVPVYWPGPVWQGGKLIVIQGNRKSRAARHDLFL